MGGNNITGVGSISGASNTRTADNIAAIPGAQTYGNITMMSTVTKALEDSGVSSFSVVTGPASAVNNQVALYNGTTGKAIQTGTAAIGTLGALTLANTTASSPVSTGALIVAGGAGIGGKAFIGDSILVNTTSVNAKVMVSGGVQNVASEDTCIRATGSSTATKIELQNTGASGKNFELRSTSSGNFEITDRTSLATRLTISGTHLGINAVPIASGAGCIYLASGTCVLKLYFCGRR